MSEYSNLLHTKSDYAEKGDYVNIINKEKKLKKIKELEKQIAILKDQEIAFYKTLGSSAKTFNEFLEEIRNKVADVKDCFDRLSSYNKQEGLFQYLLNNVSLNYDLSPTPMNKKEISLLKEEKYITPEKDTATQLKTDLVIDVKSFIENNEKFSITFYASKNKGGRKNSRTKKITNYIKELTKDIQTLSIKEFENIIAPKLAAILTEEIGKDFLISVPQIMGSLKKAFVQEMIKQNKLLTQEVANALYDQSVGLTTQRNFFTAQKNIATKAQKEKVKEILLNYLIRGVENPQDFVIAFNKAWDRNNQENGSKQLIESIFMPGTSNFTGAMGELGGLILLYYLRPDGAPDIVWSGANINDYNEQMRADILFGTMGIQVKNYKEKTIQSSNVTIKLHPKELLERLVDGGFTKKQESGMMDLLVNMAFNKDTEQVYEKGVIDILQHYLGATLNFNLDNEERDASNLWLVGGNLIIPGSSILEAFKEKINQDKTLKIQIMYPAKRKGDIQFANSNSEKGKNSPVFTEYWRRYSSGWTPYNGEDAEGNEKTYNNLLSSNAISIQTSFNFANLFGGTKKLVKDYAFL